MPTRLCLAFAALVLLSGCLYDPAPYPGATYRRYGDGHNTRYGYVDPWEVGRPVYPHRSSGFGGFSTFGYGGYGGYGGHSHRHHDHYDHDDHDDHRSSSSSSRKKSGSGSSSGSSSSRSSGGGSSRSQSDRAAEWQKDKGGIPRARRGKRD